MGHWLPSQAIVRPFNGVASCGDLLVIKPWIHVLQMGLLLMNRTDFGRWETLQAGTIQAWNVRFHFHRIICLSTSRLPRPQLANDNWLQMQVYPLGCVLYWKECVQFLDCLSWLVQIQWLPPGISLERECPGRAYGSSSLTAGCHFSRAPGSYSTISHRLGLAAITGRLLSYSWPLAGFSTLTRLGS